MTLKKLLTSLTIGLALFIGGITVTSSHSIQAASRHYTRTPVSLRGKWATPTHKGGFQYLHITKYIFYVAGYQNGRKQSGSWGVSGKKFLSVGNQTELYVSKHPSHKGYWTLGAADSDGIWHLKRVRHHGKVALKSWGYTMGPGFKKHPVWVSYYYRK